MTSFLVACAGYYNDLLLLLNESAEISGSRNRHSQKFSKSALIVHNSENLPSWILGVRFYARSGKDWTFLCVHNGLFRKCWIYSRSTRLDVRSSGTRSFNEIS